jgi:hypothetical protein
VLVCVNVHCIILQNWTLILLLLKGLGIGVLYILSDSVGVPL